MKSIQLTLVAIICLTLAQAAVSRELSPYTAQPGTATFDLPDVKGTAQPGGLSRAGGTGQFLGQLVPALYPGDAGAGEASAKAELTAVRNTGRQCRRAKIQGMEVCKTHQLRLAGIAGRTQGYLQRMGRQCITHQFSARQAGTHPLPGAG